MNQDIKNKNMETLTFKSAKELKKFTLNNREQITNINGVEFKENYPLLEVTNKHASYYNVEKQDTSLLFPPFNVSVKND